jgi:hypothetical protein
LTSTPTITANWEADSTNDTWTVPVGGGVGRLVRFGKLPVDLKLQGFWNAEKPTSVADWSLQFQAKLLFPNYEQCVNWVVWCTYDSYLNSLEIV